MCCILTEELEKKHDAVIPNVSSCKSPPGHAGSSGQALFREEDWKRSRRGVFCLCDAVREEARRVREASEPDRRGTGRDVDHVIFTIT